MQRKVSLLIALLVLAISKGVGAGGDESEELMTQLFQRASAGDTKGVETLEPKVKQIHSPIVRYAYQIARYMANPVAYAQGFVDAFPENSEGVMGGVYQIELAKRADGQRLTPRFLYSFDELGKLAERGQSGAARKLFVVAGTSDGVVTEFVCEKATRVLVVQPAESVDALAKLGDDQRKKVYGCFHSSSVAELESIRASVSGLASGKHVEIANEVLASLKESGN
jgi:hypothetical protein